MRPLSGSFTEDQPNFSPVSSCYRFGAFHLKDGESLWLNGTLLPLSPLQLRLLCCLCRHPQQVLEKDQIVQEVWGRSDVSDVSLARAVHGLRGRLSGGGKPSELIRNVYGRGYILTATVQESESFLPAEQAMPDAGFPGPDDTAAAPGPVPESLASAGRRRSRELDAALIAG